MTTKKDATSSSNKETTAKTKATNRTIWIIILLFMAFHSLIETKTDRSRLLDVQHQLENRPAPPPKAHPAQAKPTILTTSELGETSNQKRNKVEQPGRKKENSATSTGIDRATSAPNHHGLQNNQISAASTHATNRTTQNDPHANHTHDVKDFANDTIANTVDKEGSKGHAQKGKEYTANQSAPKAKPLPAKPKMKRNGKKGTIKDKNLETQTPPKKAASMSTKVRNGKKTDNQSTNSENGPSAKRKKVASTAMGKKNQKNKKSKRNAPPLYDLEGPWNVNVPENNSTAPWAAMCMVAGNEDAYINEWADYHLGLGFGHIYVFDNGPNNTLKEFGEQKHGVQVIHEYHKKEKRTQQKVYNHCVDSLRAMARPPRWVMFLDGDEFLVLRNQTQYENVNEFLEVNLPEGALQLNWLVFGTANHTKYSSEPVTKRFQYRMASPDTNSKTVARLDHIKSMEVHYAQLQNSKRRVGMGGRKVGMGPALAHVPNGDVSEAAIYHFMFKSEEEFYNKRCIRGNINQPPIWCGAESKVGEVFDDTAWQTLLRNVPEYGSNITTT